MSITGFDIVVSDALPALPSPGEVGKRIVRHGLADVLAWLGEDVGPLPTDAIHAIHADRTLYVSAETFARLRQGIR